MGVGFLPVDIVSRLMPVLTLHPITICCTGKLFYRIFRTVIRIAV
jgi:hypothetical protein